MVAAEGWLELGDPSSANEELEMITASLRSHPDVLAVRWQIHAHDKKWEACLEISEAIIKLAPGKSFGSIHRSFALHELKYTQEAFDALLPAAHEFEMSWTIPYNLACYCAQLGRLVECKEWFKKVMTIDEHAVKEAAIDDPDLKPLWDSMGRTRWKGRIDDAEGVFPTQRTLADSLERLAGNCRFRQCDASSQTHGGVC